MTMPPPGQWPPPPPQGPPQYWGAPPPPPQGRGKTKWVLGGLGILVVVVISVVATLLVSGQAADTANGPHSTATSISPAPNTSSPKADDGQIAIITSEPTCGEWNAINDALAAAENSGWGDRDPSVPASAWRGDQLAQFRAVGEAMRTAAQQVQPLARKTPNYMVRGLYSQFIAYATEYANRIPVLEPIDDHLARVTVGTTLALSSICNAIAYGSAESRANLDDGRPAVGSVAPNGDLDSTTRFLNEKNKVCPEISQLVDNFSNATAGWRSINPSIPAANWNPEQKKTNDDVIPVMISFADEITELGRRSDNSGLEDLALLAATYRRTFAAAIPTYLPADNFLNEVAVGVVGAINEACFAMGG